MDRRITYGRNGVDFIFSDLLIKKQVEHVSGFLASCPLPWVNRNTFKFFLNPKFSLNDLFVVIKSKLGGDVFISENSRLVHQILDDNEKFQIFSETTYTSKPLYSVLTCSSWAGSSIMNEEYKRSIAKILDKHLLDGDSFVPIKWFYLSYGDVHHSDIVEVIDEDFYQDAYPYIDNLDKYMDDYLDSNETILLLKGGVGTGKTRFIRHLIYKMLQRNKVDECASVRDDYAFTSDRGLGDNNRAGVMYASDPEVFKTDEVFVTYMEAQNQVLVLEDMDTLLQSRTQGNTFVNRLLAASDGLISSVRNKMVISTNLSSVERDIDSALLRPGRCFDVLEFRALEYDEVLGLVPKLGLLVDEFEKLVSGAKKERYTLAEVYRIVNQKRVFGYEKKRFGFTN